MNYALFHNQALTLARLQGVEYAVNGAPPKEAAVASQNPMGCSSVAWGNFIMILHWDKDG